MPTLCKGCSSALPEKAAFCPRCGRPSESFISIRDTPQSLLRQLATMVQQHSRRALRVKFISPWGFELDKPQEKVKALHFHEKVLKFFAAAQAFRITPASGKTLFGDGAWADITLHVLQEAGIDEAKALAEAYRSQTERNVKIVKKYR